MTNDTRYQRQKQQDLAKARHANIVGKLASGPVEKFELELEKSNTKCRDSGLPSRWVDWASDPYEREDYEGESPTEREATEMCAGCPLAPLLDARGRIVEKGACLTYAEATGQYHGVWGGKRRENGKWLDRVEHTVKKYE
jgi:hypothetical protein